MHIYYLDEPLSDEDVSFVQEALDVTESIEQIRVPYVLPILLEGALTDKQHRQHEEMLRGHLRKVGIGRDHGSQVVLVAPKAMYWYAVLVGAVFEETGAYPYLVQTEQQRAAIGNSGEARLLDTHGLMGFKD